MHACNGLHHQKKRDNVEDYVDDYLKKPAYLRTYSNNFHAIPDENLWPNGNFKTVLPPIKKRGVGRPKLSRKKDQLNLIRCKGQLGLDVGYVKRLVTTPERAKTNQILR